MSNAFTRLATISASTKRPPAVSSGKRGTPATQISSLSCTPLDPVDPELAQRMALDTPHELLQTFVEGTADIDEGDILVVGSDEYPIRSVADWTWQSTTYRHLVIEELKDS